MNDEKRVALVEELEAEIAQCIDFHQRLAYADAYDIEPDSDLLKGHEGIGEGTSETTHGVMEVINGFIDRILADRAVPEPDAIERAALVEELAAALYQHDSDKHGIVRLAWDVPVGPRTDALKDDFRETAQGLMPIIDRLLAERDIDAMLNAVHGFPSIKVWEIDYLHGTIGYACEIDNTVGHPTATGTGPTRTAAIADACRKAREQKEAGDADH